MTNMIGPMYNTLVLSRFGPADAKKRKMVLLPTHLQNLCDSYLTIVLLEQGRILSVRQAFDPATLLPPACDA